MAYAQGSSSGQSNPWLTAGAGAAAGIALDRSAMDLQKAKSRANWALGLAIGLFALEAVSSSDLNTDQANAASIITAASALTFTSAGATGEQVAALRSQVVLLAGVVQQTAYDANIMAFNGRPATPASTNPAASGGLVGAITQSTVSTTTNNNIVIVALVVVAVLAIAFMS